MEKLSSDELARYARHFNLSEVGIEGQEKLKSSKVLLIGAGGLGSPLALYLAAAGVGRIGLVDYDVVDESNLQRQILHETKKVGSSKLSSAKERLLSLNPHIEVEIFETKITSKNAFEIIKDFDVVADGGDNFPTRYLINDACVLLKKPLVSGSIMGFEGQLSVFNYEGGPCYRCLFPEPPPPGTVPSCAEGGVLGVLPGVMGTLQATEVIKILLNIGDIVSGRMILYDALALSFTDLKMGRDSNCKICGDDPSIKDLIDYEDFCGMKSEEEIQVPEIDSIALKEILDDVILLDVREDHEREICKIDKAIHIPLSKIVERAGELQRDKRIVVHCKLGGRSLKASKELIALGFTSIENLKGGIIDWIDKVEPSKKKY